MPWTCEYCGWENLQDDRVGMQEPSCPRCHLRRGSLEANIVDLLEEIDGLQEDDRVCVDQIRHYKSVIEDLWTELHGYEDRHDTAVREHRDNLTALEIAREKLRKLQAIAPTGRRVAEDQHTLPGVQA